jgi:hypothetical protein
MIRVRTAGAVLLAGLFGNVSAGSAPSSLVTGSIRFNEGGWGVGSLPSLTFTVSPGRGGFGKVLAFLYVSEEPGAFLSSPFPPQFVGVLQPPASVSVVVDRTPERGPINAHSREKFVQGALFDPGTGLLLGATNEAYLDVHYDAAPVTYALDFETEDDFASSLVNGQDLSTPPEFGVLFSVSSLQPASGAHHFGPAIFDSSPSGPNQFSSDRDLLVDRGKLVILQENSAQTQPGIFDKPDDSANGGTLVFDFTGFDFIEKVEPVAVDLIDIDLGSPRATHVVLTDVLGATRTYDVPAGWTEDITREGPPGLRTLDLTTLAPQPGFIGTATAHETSDYIPGEVVRMEIDIGGSGAVDNLVFRREADPGSSPIVRRPVRERDAGGVRVK